MAPARHLLVGARKSADDGIPLGEAPRKKRTGGPDPETERGLPGKLSAGLFNLHGTSFHHQPTQIGSSMRSSFVRASRIERLSQCLVVALAYILIGCGGEPSVNSFSNFQKCQEKYCWEVAEFLNTPIDWHIVLDVSGSYLEAGDPITEKLLLLIRSLPLQEGDSLTLDGFSQDYYEGDKHQEVTSEWIQRVKGDRGNLIVQSDVEHLFTRLDDKPPFPYEITDIAGLFTGLQPRLSSHTPHAEEKSRLYYVVLTDGAHDPIGNRVPVPLFQSPQKPDPQFVTPQNEYTTFLNALVSFVGKPQDRYFRALFIIIDPEPIDWRKGPDPVRRDWDQGIRQIANLKSKNKAILLHAAFWNKGGDSFTASVKRQIGRLGGIYPCLVTVNQESPGAWPTVTGVPYPALPNTCYSEKSNKSYVLEIPPDFANGQKENAEFPLVLLASESRKRELLVTFRSIKEDEEHGGGRESKESKGNKINSAASGIDPEGNIYRTTETFESIRGDAYSGWKPIVQSIQVPSFEDDPNFQFPWGMELRFHSQREQSPFLEAKLLEPRFWPSVLEGMSHRGKTLIFYAFLSWAFSILCAWLYAESVKMSVKVQVIGGAELELLEERRKFGRKQRVRHLKPAKKARLPKRLAAGNQVPEKLEIRDVDREDLPEARQVREDHIVFDIIPVFNVVYHLVYVGPGQRFDFGHSDGYESISFSEQPRREVFSGAFLNATTFWKPSESNVSGRWGWLFRMLGPWRRCEHKWEQQIKSSSFKWSYKATTTIEEGLWAFSCRVASVILSSLAFGFSVAAIGQSTSRSYPSNFVYWFGGSFFIALAVYTIRYWPQWTRSRTWLWADSFCTFALHTVLAMGLFSSVFAKTSVNRLAVVTIIFVGCIFAVPTYEKLRDRLVSSRIKNQQPVNKWDFFLEIFLARLCSW